MVYARLTCGAGCGCLAAAAPLPVDGQLAHDGGWHRFGGWGWSDSGLASARWCRIARGEQTERRWGQPKKGRVPRGSPAKTLHVRAVQVLAGSGPRETGPWLPY